MSHQATMPTKPFHYAPKKMFLIRPNYVQGLSDKVKELMSDRDLARTQLSKENLTFVERKALTMKYRKLRNKAPKQNR